MPPAGPASHAAMPETLRLPGAGTSQSTAQIGAYTVFNHPSADNDPDYAIEEHAIELIDGAPAGSSIHGAMFSWTRDTVAQALARARDRGVNVYLAVDRAGSDGVNTDPENAAISTLKGAGLNRLVFCGNDDLGNSSCIGNRENSINHNKLFAFSSTNGMSDVVMVGSQNWTNSQNSNFNNAVVVHGDADLYQFFLQHFENLLDQRRDNNYHQSPDGYFRSDASNVRVYFSPNADSNGGTEAEAATDIMAKRLTWMTKYESGCKVDVAHAQFTGPRKPVADELIRIAGLGCKVRITGDMTDYIYDHLSGRENITIRRLDHMHSKYMIVHGNYNDKADRTLVYTGSHNLTGPALRAHDETLIRVERPEISSAFQENFDLIWDRAG